MAQQTGIPEVLDKRPKLSGLLPRNSQTWLLLGVSLLMVLIMLFSGHTSAPAKPRASIPTPDQKPIDPNAQRIRDYQEHIEEQARQLALEEAQLAHTKQVLGVPTGTTPTGGTLPSRPMAEYVVPEKSWIELDQEKRDYQGRYASNIVFTLRQGTAGSIASRAEPLAPATDKALPEESGTPPVKTKQYRLFEGTLLETVLTNRLDSTFSGPVNCLVTTDVYAPNHETLLVPKGSRVLGEAKKLEAFGEARLAVIFHRLIMPDGYSANLDQFKALDQVGRTGLLDEVDHHYLQIFGVSLAIGSIAGLSQASSRYGIDESGVDAYKQGVATSLSQSSLHILDRYLNVLPTFTIREGHRIKVYLSQDLLLPAYVEHPVTD